MTRRKLTEAEKRGILDRQFWRCPGLWWLRIICGRDFYCTSDAEFDHFEQLSLSKDDTQENLRGLCPRCHEIKTNGLGGLRRISTAGSDTGKRKKHRKLTRWQAEFEERVLNKPCGQKREPTGKWPKRTLRSRKGKRDEMGKAHQRRQRRGVGEPR